MPPPTPSMRHAAGGGPATPARCAPCTASWPPRRRTARAPPLRHHPHYAKPELLATGPNQVWSWDITKLKGPVKWTYFYLYVILDVFSRYVVGWMVATRESGQRWPSG